MRSNHAFPSTKTAPAPVPGRRHPALCILHSALCVLALALPAWPAPAAPLDLPLPTWRFRAAGNFTGAPDRRGLFQIVHPLAEAKAGDYGRIERQVTIPATLPPPYTLRFYVSDNVNGEGHGPNSVVDVRVGHRFAQALVDGKVVWSQDTAANSPLSHPEYVLVDITPHVRAGREFTLALQLRQEVDSARRLPGDEWQPGVFAGTTEKYQPLPWEQYGTRSYWGDVAIHAGPPPRAGDLRCVWEPRLKRTSPQFPRVPAAVRETAFLAIEKGELLTGAWPWPVTQGIPLPMGALADVKNLALTAPDGRPVPAAFTPLSRWPDGSLRWVQAEFALPPGSRGPLSLAWGRDIRPVGATPAHPVRTTDDLRLGNGLVWAQWKRGPTGGATAGAAGQDKQGVPGTGEPAGEGAPAAAGTTKENASGPAVQSKQGAAGGRKPAGGGAPGAAGPSREGASGIAGQGKQGVPGSAEDGAPGELVIGRGENQVVCAGLQPYLTLGSKPLRATWRSAQWLSRSPHGAEIQVTGDLRAEDGARYGTCRVRVALFAGSPLVRLLVTIVNERADAVPEDKPDNATVKSTGGLVGGVRPVTAVVTAYGLRLLVPDAGPQGAGEGWATVAAKAGAVTGVVRDLKHIGPAGLLGGNEGLDFQLFKPRDASNAPGGNASNAPGGNAGQPTYNTYAGEAKTHEIWLALAERAPEAGAAANLAQRVEAPPRLDTSALIRRSYVWGAVPRLSIEEHPAEYALIAERALAPFYRNTLQGIRQYGGYSPGTNNFYWNRLHSIYLLYAMTGERKWYDWAERSIRHYMDVCTLHWSPDGTNVGGKVRNIDRFFAIYLVHQNPHPLFDHWNLTGDPEGLRLGRANADFIQGNPQLRRETEGRSARQQGWPLMAMVRAWQETGEARYADHAKHILDVTLDLMEQRRGAYVQNHGSNSHMGIVPFMSGILCSGLRDYHFWTGDARAGVALLQNAEAIYAEMHDPACSKTSPNVDYYYSPNPYLCGTDGKTPIAHLNPNIAAALAYSAHLADDPALADIAWRSWKAYLQVSGWEQNSYDYLYDLPNVLYWLDKAPVPNRKPQLTVARFWRWPVAAPEIWIDRPDARPFRAQVRWTTYETPYHRGRTVPAWPEYCRRRGVRGEVQILDPDGKPAASVPMQFGTTPYGASVTLSAGAGKPGLYRLVIRGAEEAPVSLVLQDLSPHLSRWGVPIDRGWVSEADECWFRLPADARELALRYGSLAPWEKVTLEVLDADGRPANEPAQTASERWQQSWLTAKVAVPADARGKMWRIRQSPAPSAIVRVDGAPPLVSVTPEACFTPARVPPPRAHAAADQPREWRGSVAVIEAGKRMVVPRGAKTGDGQYEHVHVRQGTIEFWLRADTSDDSVENLSFLRFGRLNLWRRTQLGTYFNLGKGFLQSGFLIRPRVWYHVALTWDLGGEARAPRMNLFLDGVPVMAGMQEALPADTGDWTGDALEFGTAEPMRVCGLRISSVARDQELQRGSLSPAPDAQTLYWQEGK